MLGLLNWTKEQLAANAIVSRAIIANFEARARQPMKNNLCSIADCMFAPGVDFIPEEGSLGVGVRCSKRKVTCVKSASIDRFNRTAKTPMCPVGRDFACIIDMEAVEDSHRSNFATEDEFAKAITDIFRHVYSRGERYTSTLIEDGSLLVTCDMLLGTDEGSIWIRSNII